VVEAPAYAPQVDETFRLRRTLHERLIEAFDVRRTDTHRMDDAALRQLTEDLIRDLIQRMGSEIPPQVDRPVCWPRCATRPSAWDRWSLCWPTRR
jgi:hypothetical protein